MGFIEDMIQQEKTETESSGGFIQQMIEAERTEIGAKPYRPQPGGEMEEAIIPGPREAGVSAPSWGAQFKASFADTPEIQARILASSMFPKDSSTEAAKKFGFVDGNWVYRDAQGNLRYVEDQDFAGAMKGLSAKLPAMALVGVPAVAGEVAGTAVGFPGLGAAVGAGAGEAARQGIGYAAFDDPFSVGQIGLQSAAALGGQKLGLGVVKGTNFGRNIKAGRARREIVRVLDEMDLEKSVAAKKYAQREMGVDLNLAQATEDPNLIANYDLLGKTGSTARIIQRAREAQYPKAEQSAYRFLDKYSASSDPQLVGRDIIAALNNHKEGLITARTKAASPLYSAAERSGTVVDITEAYNILKTAEGKLPKGSPRLGSLKRVENMLKTQTREPEPYPELYAPDETLITRPPVPQTVTADIGMINEIKQDIDFLLSRPDKFAIQKDLKRRLMKVQSDLLKKADVASPEFEAARKAFAQKSPEIDAFDKSILGEIAKIEKDAPTEKVVEKIFGRGLSVESIYSARAAIEGQDPELWKAAVRIKMQDVIAKSVKSTSRGEPGNIGGKIYQGLWGDTVVRNKLKAAMTKDQFQNLENFTDAMRRFGRTYGLGQLPTLAAQEETEKAAVFGLPKQLVKLATSPLISRRNAISRNLIAMRSDAYRKKLAELILDPNSVETLERVKLLSPRSEGFLEALGTFLGSAAMSYEQQTPTGLGGLPE